MKYLGEKSLSSFLSGFCHICWYVVLVSAIICGLFGSYFFLTPPQDPTIVKIAAFLEWNHQNEDWVAFMSLPLALRLLLLPYFIAIVVLILRLIKTAEHLFTNFKKNIVFHASNVSIIATLSKLLIAFSIFTFNLSSLIVSLLLLLLSEIFKKGTVLQDEHDFTV